MALARTPAECPNCEGDTLCFGHKVKTLVAGVTRSQNTREFRHPTKGHRVKVTKDDATRRGNLTIEHATKDDRVDVKIRPDKIDYTLERKS
jgi:hypothetical protein